MAFGETINFNPSSLGPAFQFKSTVSLAADANTTLAGNNSDRIAIGFVDFLGGGGGSIAPYPITLENVGWPLIQIASQSLVYYFRDWGPIVGYEWFRDDAFFVDILVWEMIYNPSLLIPIPEPGDSDVL
jgi:hypothetical protein